MSYIRVDARKVGISGKSLAVTIPSTFVEFERIKRRETWYFLYSLGGHVMIFAKEHDLEVLRKELEHLLELIEFEEKQGLTRLRHEDRGHYY